MKKDLPAGSPCRPLRSRRGVASALIIMILVLLIFFAVLSLVASAADLRLARKRAEWNQQYYQADAGAVELYAGIRQVCDTQPPNVQTAILAGQLKKWLEARDDIREYTLAITGDVIQLDILTSGQSQFLSQNPGGNANPDAQTPQGIQMTLLVAGSRNDLESSRLTIIKWAQWQMPFAYETENGGVWEG
jgi:hypothetical protein